MKTQEVLDPQRWAERTFGSVALKDTRRTRRAVWAATQMARNASASLPQQMQTWKDVKALLWKIRSSGEHGRGEIVVKKSKTATFLVELPVVVEEGAARRVRAHLEAARQLYNALLSEGLHRLRQMRADPAWQAARDLQKQERKRAFTALREQYGFNEYALHAAAKILRVMAAMEDLIQRAKAGHALPQSFGLTRARVRQPESLAPN